MYHKSLKRNMGLSVLILVLVSLSIGYAIISSNLELNGNAKIANMAWQVYFDNVKVTDGSTGLSVPTLSADKTSVSFTTSFTKPTDYYDFTLDLINAGTIAAKVDSVVLSGLTAEQDVYANYRVTYVGGGEISAGDTLNPGETRKIRVRLEMDSDVDGSLLPSTDATLALSAKINFVQGEEVKYLMDVIKKEAVLDSIASTYVTSSSGIDFSAVSSDTNGKGVYTLTSSASDKYPIYYYRGAVENNNVIFGGFCWKMVRTTETGGIKLIYNGTPTDGTCVATGADTTIGGGNFNGTGGPVSSIGYMYSMNYSGGFPSSKVPIVMAKNISYENGVYTLSDTYTVSSKSDTNWHNGYFYSCLSENVTCTTAYIFPDNVFSYAFKNGITNAYDLLISLFSEHTKSSNIKESVENWYSLNLTSNNNYLEDEKWCYDTSVSDAGAFGGGSFDSTIYFAVGQRTDINLTCKYISDNYTVSNAEGNGSLTYPIALLTLDEARLAGAAQESNTSFYLNNSTLFYLFSPYRKFSTVPVYISLVSSSGAISNDVGGNEAYRYRPAISLKVGTTYTSGSGTSSDPYII